MSLKKPLPPGEVASYRAGEGERRRVKVEFKVIDGLFLKASTVIDAVRPHPSLRARPLPKGEVDALAMNAFLQLTTDLNPSVWYLFAATFSNSEGSCYGRNDREWPISLARMKPVTRPIWDRWSLRRPCGESTADTMIASCTSCCRTAFAEHRTVRTTIAL